MKILYLGSSGGTSGHRSQALQRLGHQVVSLDPAATVPANRAVAQWRRHTGGAGLVEITRRRILQVLDQKAMGETATGAEPFDLAWIDHGDLVSARLVDDLKARASQVLCYTIDDPFGGRDRLLWREFLKALPGYDLTVVVRACNVQEAYDRGAKRVLRVYMSADEVAHAPRQLTAADREAWRSEVAFIGTAFPERGPFLAELARLGVPLSIYGNGYQRLPQWPRLKDHWRAANTDIPENYAKAIGAARVCLGLLSRGNRDQHTTRSMEIPSFGGLLCAERTPEHLGLYEEDREAVFWETPEECAARCRLLLADPAWREAVAAAGRRRYLASPWQNMRVVESILNALASASGQAEAAKLPAERHRAQDRLSL